MDQAASPDAYRLRRDDDANKGLEVVQAATPVRVFNDFVVVNGSFTTK
jgi:hypothetical protein